MPNGQSPPPPAADNGKAKLIAAVGAPAAALLLSLVTTWEGKRNDPYQDIVKVWTVCYGETRVAMRHYTDAQCSDMLAGALGDFALPVLRRNPGLRGRPYQLAPAVSLSYNIGEANYARSTVSARFAASRWRDGCAAFTAWDKAGGKFSQGLYNRRVAEQKICFTGL